MIYIYICLLYLYRYLNDVDPIFPSSSFDSLTNLQKTQKNDVDALKAAMDALPAQNRAVVTQLVTLLANLVARHNVSDSKQTPDKLAEKLGYLFGVCTLRPAVMTMDSMKQMALANHLIANLILHAAPVFSLAPGSSPSSSSSSSSSLGSLRRPPPAGPPANTRAPPPPGQISSHIPHTSHLSPLKIQSPANLTLLNA